MLFLHKNIIFIFFYLKNKIYFFKNKKNIFFVKKKNSHCVTIWAYLIFFFTFLFFSFFKFPFLGHFEKMKKRSLSRLLTYLSILSFIYPTTTYFHVLYPYKPIFIFFYFFCSVKLNIFDQKIKSCRF